MPDLHTEDIRPPPPPTSGYTDDVSMTIIFSSHSVVSKHEFNQECSKPHLISQGELNDLVRDLKLNKENNGKGFIRIQWP